MSDNNDNEEFNLYTEKIVQKPFAKYKRLVKLMRIAGRGAVFGAVACDLFKIIRNRKYGRKRKEEK